MDLKSAIGRRPAPGGRRFTTPATAQVRRWAVWLLIVAGVVAVMPRPVHAVSATPEDAAWANWSPAGWSMGTPSVVSTGTGLVMFIRGVGSDVWERSWNGSSWGGLVDLGGGTLSTPVGVTVSPTVVDVFVRGLDNATWYRSDNGGSWGAWTSLGGITLGAPAVDSPQPGQLAVFVRGSDTALWGKTYSGGWGGWYSFGGLLSSAPSATSSAAGRSDVVGRGRDGELWYLPLVNNAAGGWQPLGGLLDGDPAIASWGPGRLDVFIEGIDKELWHLADQPGSGWTSWVPMGGVLEDGPTSLASAPGTVDAFVLGQDDSVYLNRWTGLNWTGFDDLGMASPQGQIPNVPYYAQVYELSCEEAALQMALATQGISVTQAQVLAADGVNAAPGYVSSDGVLHWGDPYQYFVGDVNGSEVNYTGYGTYDTTIVKAADSFGGEVLTSGQWISPSALYAQVIAGHPVVAWVSFDYQYHAPGTMLAWDGLQVIWSGPIEHALTVVGVTSSSVLVYNPWFGIQWLSRGEFEQSYATYDDMAVVLN